MLLVDDHGAEAGEVDGVLDQRMGADHDVDRTVGEPGEHLLAVGTGDAVREQFDPQRPITEQVARVRHAHAFEQRPHPGRMLFGQDFRGGHQRCLMTALHRHHHRVDRDHGLARTDVALQQPVHRVRCGHVGFDLCDGALLGAGQRIRQCVEEPRHQIAAEFVGDAALVALHCSFAKNQHQLDPEELIEGEASTGLFLVADRLRQVDVREGVEACEHPETLRDLGWNRVGDPPVAASAQCFLDPPGDLPGRDLRLLALRVDRHDPAGSIADQVDDRVRHLQAATVDVGLAEQGHLEAFSELPLAPRLVEEHHLHAARTVADVDVDHRSAIPGDPLGHRPHGRQHQRLLARDQVGDARLVGTVDPTTRIEGDQVEQVLDTDCGERRTFLVADAPQPIDIDRGEVAEGECVHSTPKR